MRTIYLIHPISLECTNPVELRLAIEEMMSNSTLPQAARKISDNRSDYFVGGRSQDFGYEHFVGSLYFLRRLSCLAYEINISREISESFGLRAAFFSLLVLSSGDVCLVFAGKYSTAHEDTISVDEYQSTVYPLSKQTVKGLVASLSRFYKGKIRVDNDTPIHTVHGIECENREHLSLVAKHFLSEGLDINQRKKVVGNEIPWQFYSGWSHSAIERGCLTEEFLIVGTMMKLQLSWFSLRRLRKRSLKTSQLFIARKSISHADRTRSQINSSIFFLQIAQQELSDFRANLKPWARTVFDEISSFWELENDYKNVLATLERSREYFYFLITDQSLVQSRVQSFLLYFIAGLDTFAISSIFLSVLAFERSSENSFVFDLSTISNSAISGVLLANIVVFIVLLSLALWRRFF